MLNISHNQLNKKVTLQGYKAFSKAVKTKHYKMFNRFLLAFGTITIIIMLLPWTQNVTGNGYVTTLTPGQRPQTIQSQIPGRIEKWYVREGDFVKKGDTILFISEIKTEYQDPKLVERTNAQRDAKSRSVVFIRWKNFSIEKPNHCPEPRTKPETATGKEQITTSPFKGEK